MKYNIKKNGSSALLNQIPNKNGFIAFVSRSITKSINIAKKAFIAGNKKNRRVIYEY